MKHIKTITEDFYRFNSNDLLLLRKRMGKSQQAMANFLGFTSRSYICHFEKKNKPLPKHLALLCNLVKNNLDMEEI
jgi:transcriptional regulator with XRE-family HTH domain